MRTAGMMECTDYMGSEKEQSRCYYFYYITDVLWNSSLKQAAAAAKKNPTQTPSTLTFPSPLLFPTHKFIPRTLIEKVWGIISQPVEEPLRTMTGSVCAYWCMDVPSLHTRKAFIRWNFPARVYSWNLYIECASALTPTWLYRVQGVGMVYIYTLTFSTVWNNQLSWLLLHLLRFIFC